MSVSTPREPGHRATIDLPSWLAYVYAPILPVLRRAIRLRRVGGRDYQPRDILLPRGFAAEVVTSGLNTPVHCCFDDQGFCYVIECGHKIEAKPRILKVHPATGASELFFEWLEERWEKTGAVTGACWYQGFLYVASTDTLSRIGPDRQIEDIVTDLPGKGDHQTNYPVLGPDGKLYWGQGSATNTGVVGADNFAYEWLPKFPEFCDVPAHNITLAGHNYEYRNVLGNLAETVRCGAYVPFGTESRPGQVIAGNSKCTGAVLRCNPNGSDLEVVAWGLRNPYGLAFHSDGRLFATEHGIDERSRRHIIRDPDDFYEIRPGEWYGWPDFASGIRLDDPRWGEGGAGREPVLAEHPNLNPPKPFVSFEPHAGSNGVDFCRDPRFGFEGDAFVALFGDLAPVTTPRQVVPAGFKVVRVDMRNRRVVDFAVNKIAGPASKLPHDGFERPSHCAFGPDGALYVVDWGEIQIAAEAGGVRMVAGTGALWRIRRTAEPPGEQPQEPMRVPFYPLQYLLMGAGVVGLAGAAWLVGRWRAARRQTPVGRLRRAARRR
jgi:glucose/arabinose dehydrogenase